MKFALFLGFFLLVNNLSAQAVSMAPLVLDPDEYIAFQGNLNDSVDCDGKNYSSQNFSIVATETPSCDAKCNCTTDPIRKVYIDGLLAAVCAAPMKFHSQDAYPNAFTNIDFLRHLTDKELIKLFSTSTVGACRYIGNSIVIVKEQPYRHQVMDMKDSLQAYTLQNSLKLKNSNLQSEQVVAQSLRDMVRDNICGSFSKEVVAKNLEASNRILGTQDIGFDYLVSAGAHPADLLKMHYPAAKLRKNYGFKLADFVKEDYSAADLKRSGFGAVELKGAGFGISDLASAGFDPKTELKTLFSLQDFIKAGYSNRSLNQFGFTALELKGAGSSPSDLLQAGYSIADVKPLFTAQDFKAVGYSNRSLNQFGFTAQELKNIGSSPSDLLQAGYSIGDVKPLFTAQDFKNVGYSNRSLNQFGFTATELKDIGSSPSDLLQAGYDISAVKPLFSAQDFKNVGYSNRSMNQFGFTAKEMQATGCTPSDLLQAGYSITDVKPLYAAQDFMSVGYSATSMRQFGFTAQELLAAGYTIDQLKYAGYSDAEILKK